MKTSEKLSQTKLRVTYSLRETSLQNQADECYNRTTILDNKKRLTLLNRVFVDRDVFALALMYPAGIPMAISE